MPVRTAGFPFLLSHLLDISLNRHQAVTVEASGACNDGYRNWL